jgi:hypothetical protein
MKKTIPILAVLIGLAVPTAAQATGTHPPTTTPPAKDCDGCCGDLRVEINQLRLVFDQRITTIEQKNVEQDNRLSVIENTVQNLNNYIVQIDQRTTQIINRIDALSCQSNRIYTYRLRTEVDGVPVTKVNSVTVAGTTERGSFTRANGRFVVRADYRGITAPSLQFRTAMTNVTLANGDTVDLVQYVRLCGDRDGDPNDTPAQDRASR